MKTMEHTSENEMQGHWLLAKMGKRVLRPGGRKLTERMMRGLDINNQDDVVEFAPGMGFTAQYCLVKEPRSYIGVDLNPLVVQNLQTLINRNPSAYRLIQADAANTGIKSHSKTKVYGEAMLTMQTEQNKCAIMAEAFRILSRGGLYGIHEMAVRDHCSLDRLKSLQKELSAAINVQALPLSISAWSALLNDAGFAVMEPMLAPMKLVSPSRILRDEGICRTLCFFTKFALHRSMRLRVKAMRSIFRKYADVLVAVSFISSKS